MSKQPKPIDTPNLLRQIADDWAALTSSENKYRSMFENLQRCDVCQGWFDPAIGHSHPETPAPETP